MMLRREDIEEQELRTLAPWAVQSRHSRGREHASRPDPLRSEFQRDRDRVIHSSAFRKLEFKTQVFVTHAGDYPRTRLTHTIEVAQIARTLARALNLNVDLAEAIALAHDLGHTPFGHAGEEAMRACMKDHGGFEHNRQGLRVVTFLEERYPDRPGLNLTYEVREGIIKHDTTYDSPEPHPDYNPGCAATLEAQVCDLADEIAYTNADLDDALKMGFIALEDLRGIGWVSDLLERARHETPPDARSKFLRYKMLSRLYDACMHDVLEHSALRVEEGGVRTLDDVYAHPGRLVSFSPEFSAQLDELKDFLFRRVYQHPKSILYRVKAMRFVTAMFGHYMEHPGQMPWKYHPRIERDGAHRTVCDYVSGMTDRFLMEQYQASFMPEVIR